MQLSKLPFWRLLRFIVFFAIIVGIFMPSADAAHRRRRRVKKQPIINEKKLYERIGGSQSVSQIVDEWMRLNLADSRVAPNISAVAAKPDQLVQLRKKLNEDICEMSDGPCSEKPAEIKKIHDSLHFGDEQFLAFADNLFRSMQKLNITEREKNELLARLGDQRDATQESDGQASDAD